MNKYQIGVILCSLGIVALVFLMIRAIIETGNFGELMIFIPIGILMFYTSCLYDDSKKPVNQDAQRLRI